MDSFYSQLAAEAAVDSEDAMLSFKVNKSDTTKFKIDNNINDFEDLLNEVEFNSFHKEEQKNISESQVENQILNAEAASFTSTPSSGSSLPMNMPVKNVKNKRNILDSLLSMDVSMDTVGVLDKNDFKHEFYENNSKSKESDDTLCLDTDVKSKRFVRFSEDLKFTDKPKNQRSYSPPSSNELRKPDDSLSRPQTAPHSIKIDAAGTSWDSNDDLDWPPRRSKKPSKSLLNNSKELEPLLIEQTKENFKKSMSFPSTCAFSMSSPKSISTVPGLETDQRLKYLTSELENVKHILQMSNKYHQDEIKLLEESHLSKVNLLTENAERREKHLKEELEFNVNQCRERIIQLENYHEAMRNDLANNLATIKQDSSKTIQALRLEHSLEIDALMEKHERALIALRQADQTEARAIAEMQPTSEALRLLLTQLTITAADLQKSECERKTAANQRLSQLDQREEVLRQTEDRLRIRDKEAGETYQCLTEEVTKLELQLREQVKLLSDDRWMLKQEQGRLTKLQVALEEDRRSLVEQAGRERTELQQLMTNFLMEHRESQTRLTAERNMIMEQQQKLRTDQLCWTKRQEEENGQLNQLKDNIASNKQAFEIERHTLDERASQVRINEVKLSQTQRQLDIIRNELTLKEGVLSDRNNELERRSEELKLKASTLTGSQAAVCEIEARCQRLQEEQNRLQNELNNRSKELDEAERLLILNKQEFSKKVKKERKLICSKCKQTVTRVPKTEQSSYKRNRTFNEDIYDSRNNGNIDWNEEALRTVLDEPEVVKLVDDMSSQYGRGRFLDQLRDELAKNNDFLENERAFLNGLKHSPYS